MRIFKLIHFKSSINLIKSIQKVRYSTKPTTLHLEPVNMSFATYEGTKTASTNTAPPLIVMHGLFGSKRNWNSLCKVFNQKTNPHRQVVAVDARNHGESPRVDAHTYPHLAEDIKALCTELNFKKAALLGHSMGGRATMYFALRYPQLVDKLIIADISPVRSSPSLNSMYSIFSAIQEVNLPNNVPISSARSNCDKQLAKTITDKGLRAFLLTNLAQGSSGSFAWQVNLPAIIENFHESIARFPEIGNLQFNGPALFVAGAESDYIKKSDYSQILNIFPKAEFQEIEGAGHWLHSDKPNEFMNICLEFLNRNVT